MNLENVDTSLEGTSSSSPPTDNVDPDKCLADLYANVPYNNLKPANHADDLVSPNGGNCEFLSRKFLQSICNKKLCSEMVQ